MNFRKGNGISILIFVMLCLPLVINTTNSQAVGTPTLISPANGTVTTDTTPTFDWSDVIGADKYQLQVSISSIFLGTTIDVEVSSSTYTPTTALGDYTYYWRVRAAELSVIWGSYSSSWTVEVDTTAPSAVVLSSPTSGTLTNDPSVTFAWTSQSDIDFYQLQVDDSEFFISPELNIQTSDSEYTTTISEGSYYWHVRAQDLAGNMGSWSGSWTLEVDTTPPGIPVLVSPASGTITTDTTPYLDWNSVATATDYHIQISRNTAFTDIAKQIYVSTTYYTPPALDDDTYYWHVLAKDEAGNIGSYCDYWTFIVDTEGPIGPILINPINGLVTSDTQPTFTWETSGDSNYYRILIDNNEDFSSAIYDSYTSSTSYTPSSAFSDGSYFWKVQARDPYGNWGNWSYYRIFTIDTIPPGSISLISPSNGFISSNTSIELQWSTASDGFYYEIYIDDNPSFTSPAVILVSENYKLLDYFSGTYHWKVRALDDAFNYGSWSSTWSFTIDTTGPTITSIGFSPDPVDDTDSITISCDVTDSSGITEVILSYRVNSGSWNNITMSLASENTYEADIGTFDYNDNITYFITAYDDATTPNERVADNSGSYYEIIIDAGDTTGPTITNINLSPETPTDENSIIFSCEVTDTNNVSQVIVCYRVNGGSWTNVTMAYQINDGYAIGIGHLTYNDFLEYYLIAYDDYIVKNVAIDDNTGAYYNCTIGASDFTGPSITAIEFTPTDPTDADSLIIHVNASDPNGINNIFICYRVNGGSWTNATMMFTLSGYTVNLGTFSYADYIEFYVIAIDSYPLHNSAIDNNGGLYYDVTIASSDTTDPTISDVQHFPIMPNDLQTVTINCSVTDLSGISSVTLYYQINDGSWQSVTMSYLSGTIYTATIGSFAYADQIKYYFVATDASPNANSATENNSGSYYTFTVSHNDVTAPTIEGISSTPTPPSDADVVTITCNVTDANGLFNVTLIYRINDGSWINVTMTLATGSTYQATIGAFEIGDIIEYYIVAIDASPNHNVLIDDNNDTYYSFTVISAPPTSSTPLYFIVPTLLIIGLLGLFRRRR